MLADVVRDWCSVLFLSMDRFFDFLVVVVYLCDSCSMVAPSRVC